MRSLLSDPFQFRAGRILSTVVNMADVESVEDFISSEIGVPRATVSQCSTSSDDAKVLFEKIRDYLVNQHTIKEKLQSNVTNLRRARVNADQQFNQLEKQLISCNSKLEHEVKCKEAINKRLEKTSDELEDKSKKLHEVETIKENAATNFTRVSQLNENLEAEKLNLITTVERKNKEIDRLNGEWKSMFQKVNSANSLQYEAKAKLDELGSKESLYQLKEKRLEQEKDLLKKQNEWLDSQLKEKSEAFFSFQKEKSAKVQHLQSELDANNEEVKNLTSLTESLRGTNEDLKFKTNSFMDRIKDAKELQTKTEEQYKLEISSQSKLAMLYKDAADASKLRCEELTNAMEELENMFKKAKSECLDAETKLKESEINHLNSVKEYDEKVESLQNELTRANGLLEAARQRGTAPMSPEALAALSPTAAATSSFLKSGMTLTQIYDQYIETIDSLQLEKAENTCLKEYMDQILKEVEEKAPLLKQQRKDYENALSTVDRLSASLESAMSECERFSTDANEAVDKSKHLERENERMKLLTADLGNQVQVLLRGSVQANGGNVNADDQLGSTDGVSSSSGVISEHLVTFRNIEELQEQNQKLLTVVRELSEERENQENTNHTVHHDLKQQLDTALGELEVLKTARSRQIQMVEALVRQRDMYRVLLSNTGQSPIPPEMHEHSMTTLPISSNFKEQSQDNFEETRQALKELQKTFESYKTNRLENERQLQEKNEEIQSTIAELNIKNATVSSQLEHANERYKLLETNCNGYKREAEALRDKSHKLSLSCAKLETSHELAKQELSEVKEKLVKSEVMYENMQQERNIIKEAETRLLEENKSLINQQKGQSTLLTNLQAIQNNLERQEYETRTRLTGQIDGLDRELTVLKQKLHSDTDHHEKIVESWESQIKETKQQLTMEIEHHQDARNQLQTMRNEVDMLKNKITEKESHISASEARLNEILARQAEEDQDAVLTRTIKEQEEKFELTIVELKEKHSATENRNNIVESQLQLAKQHLSQYKAMLAASEEALAELNKTSKVYQKKMESEQTETQTSLAELQKDLTLKNAKTLELSEENNQLKSKLAEETTSLRRSVNALTADLKSAVKRAETCIVNEKRAKEICEEQKTLAAEAQEKYEKELVNHASDVKALTQAKQQLETFNVRLEEAEEKWKEAVNKLNESQISWEGQKKIQVKEVEKLVSRCGELVTQNSLLHEQGEKLSQQVLTAQSRSSSDIRLSALNEPSEETDDKTVKDLWEVIRFIRKEKEIAETKLELVQSECVRYQQRLAYVEKQLTETEGNLERERRRSNMSVKDSKEHDEIMEKVEKFGEIEELNKVLISEKESLMNRIDETDSQVKQLQHEMMSLKESIKSLISQKDMLVGEKTGLKNEIQRWRSRTNQLIEQCKQQPDPEDLKKLQEEKKHLLVQQKTSKDETQKYKVQVDALRNEITRQQAEINIKKAETAKIQEELNSLKSKTEDSSASTKLQEDFENLQKEKEAKIEEVNEKEKTISQLRRIARRYRTQCDELAKGKEDLEKRLSEEKPLEDSTEQEEIVKTLTEEKKTLEGELEKLTQTMTACKEKEEKSKKTLTSATKKIQQLTSLNDKYLNENEEVKKTLEEVRQEKNALIQTATEREMRLTVLSTQFEGKQLRIEKQLKEKNEELEKYIQEKTKVKEREAIKERENETLKKRIQQYQRLMLQAQQKLKSQASLRVAATQGQSVTSGASTSTGVENTSKELVTSQCSSNTVPPTAAIKPTATPATSVPVRPASTPTASIRPMAMTAATVQPTPTATVPPTVTTQPTAVAIVSAVNEPITATSVALRTQASASITVQAPATPLVSSVLPSVLSEVTSSPSVSVRPITSSNVSTIIAMATSSMEVNEERPADVVISSEERPSAFYTGFDTIQQSDVSKVASSQRESVDSPQPHGSKRPRDYESSVETIREEQESKKARTETKEQQLEDEVCEEVEEVEDENAADDEDVLGSAEEQESEGEPEIICIDVESDEDDVMEREIIEEDDGDDDDVIREVVDDIDIREEFGDEGISDEPDGSVQEEISDNVAVVRVNADSTPSTSNQEVRCQETTVTSHTVPSMPQIPLVRSQSHLAPFTLSQGQPGSTAFDDTDDCMVPSTPTLFIPKRSDGFGEMISSPRVHHASFLFGSTADTQTGGLAMGMSEEGLRVDDTRFDIMASSGDGDEPDLGFDNVVPDLDEAAAIEFSTEDVGGESSSVLSSMVSSTSADQSKPQSVDISEQNVPETSEKYDTIEIPDLAEEEEDGSKVKEEDGETSSSMNIELQSVAEENEGDSVLEIKLSEDDSFPDASTEVYRDETSSPSIPEPPSSTSGVGIPIQTSQEARLKANVVQLRRPAGQATAQVSGIQIPGVQPPTGRRIIRRVQARGQSAAGPRGRGRGGQ